MKIGVSMPLPPRPPAVLIDPAVMAREAEKLGFESLWVAEHSVAPVEVKSYSPVFEKGQVPGFLDPMVALGRAAAVTKSIKLATGVMILPDHNPLLLAKEVATLDLYSGGRVILGAGAGWLKEATKMLGGDPERPWAQSREAAQAMRALWSQDVAEFHGTFYDFPPVRCFPKPAQRPHVPIFLGGKGKNAIQRVVQWGDGYMPSFVTPDEIRHARAEVDRLAPEAGRDPKKIPVMIYRAPPEREALKRFEDAGAVRAVVFIPVVDTEKKALEELYKAAEGALG